MEALVENNKAITINSSLRIDELVDTFISCQDVKANSKLLYRRTLRQYFNWVECKGYNLGEIKLAHIIEYKENLLAEGKSSLTVGSYITSVRRFYEWTEANKFYPNIAKGVKTPKRKNQFKKEPLQIDKVRELLKLYREKSNLRDYAIISLLLGTGLRTIEVVRANIKDIQFKGGKRVLLVQGKGRDEKDNFVELIEQVYKPIEDYLKSRGAYNINEPLFTSTSNNSKGQKLTTRTISYIAKEGLKAIGLNDKSFTAHSLRHTVAVAILRAGGSPEQAQHTLRHSNPATTQIYTASLNEERRLANSGEALIGSLFFN